MAIKLWKHITTLHQRQNMEENNKLQVFKLQNTEENHGNPANAKKSENEFCF
jgi:hypothetical protein